MIKTQILINPAELINQTKSYRLKGILNNQEIDLNYELVINHIDKTNFIPKSALELHNQSSICVFKSGPNDIKYINTLDLRNDDFTLEMSFSFNKDSIINHPKKESETREIENYNFMASQYYWNQYWGDNKTLFINTCGYLRIYTYSRSFFIDIVEYGHIETYKLCINNNPGQINILKQDPITGMPEDGITYKYNLVINRISNVLSIILYKQYRSGYSDNWSEQEEIGKKSIRLTNSILEDNPFTYSNKSWHTTRIGHMALNDGSQTEYFFGWLHYFNLAIESVPQIYDSPDLLQMNFNIKLMELEEQCLELNFKVKKDYEVDNILQLHFSVEKYYELNNMLELEFLVEKYYELNNMLELEFLVGRPETDYSKKNILQMQYSIKLIKIEEQCLELNFKVKKDYEANNILLLNFLVDLLKFEYEKNNILQLNFITKREYNYNNLQLHFEVKSKPKDPGDRECKFDTKRKIERYIAPYNYRFARKDTERIVEDIFVKYYFDTELNILVTKEEDIGTIDDEDIIFEIADKSIFFIELDGNTANLYRKENIDSQSILMASLEKINNEELNFKNKWTHIAITYDIDTSTLVLYIDGKEAYMTTNIKNLAYGYIQLNTFNTKKSTYFAGITISDNIDYTTDFPVTTGPVSIPSTLPAITINISRIIKLVPITSIPGIVITKYRVPHIKQILFIYTDSIPAIIIEKRRFFISTRFIVCGEYIQTYINIPNLDIPWAGSRIFGPLLSNPHLIEGILSLYPRHPLSTVYSPIVRYAESWTLDFWYFRRLDGTAPHINILSIKSKYQIFKLSTNYFTSIFNKKPTTRSSIPYIPINKWVYVILSYNIQTSILSIYIDKILVYQIYIRLSSPNEILFFVGSDLTNCNFFADIRLLNTAFDDNQTLDDVKPVNPEVTTIATTLKRITKTSPGREIIFMYEGLDKHVVDYRLPIKNIDTVPNRVINSAYIFNIDYICTKLYYKPININKDYIWLDVACIGPDSNSIGYINYKPANSRRLNTYTIDFWVYKANNYNPENSLEYPLFDLIGSGNKIRVVMGNTKIRYYSYINNIWTQEFLINDKINNFVDKWTHIAITFNNTILSVFINGEKYVDSITFSSLALEELNIYANTNEIFTQYITSIRISKIARFDSVYNLNDVSHPYGSPLNTKTLADIKVADKSPGVVEDVAKETIPPQFIAMKFDTSKEYKIFTNYAFDTERQSKKDIQFVNIKFDTNTNYNIDANPKVNSIRDCRYIEEGRLFETKVRSVINNYEVKNNLALNSVLENIKYKFNNIREFKKDIETYTDIEFNYILENKKYEFSISRDVANYINIFNDLALFPIKECNFTTSINLNFRVKELAYNKSISLHFIVQEDITKPTKNHRKIKEDSAAKTTAFIF